MVATHPQMSPKRDPAIEWVKKGRFGFCLIASWAVLLMIEILHYSKDPKLWELGYTPC